MVEAEVCGKVDAKGQRAHPFHILIVGIKSRILFLYFLQFSSEVFDNGLEACLDVPDHVILLLRVITNEFLITLFISTEL